MVHPIGGLGTATEDVYNPQRVVPLFEFRDLAATTPSTKDFEKFMRDIDAAVQARHQTFANAPQRKKPGIPASCYVDATSASSVLLPLPRPLLLRSSFITKTQMKVLFKRSTSARILSPSAFCPQRAHNLQATHTNPFLLTDTTAMQTVTVATKVWTRNCATRTLVGIAAVPTCTTVSECTATVAPTIAGRE
ncbi:hypothetical protein F4823DRAFT_640643 [Ustulina deusta]|nr:hypothetical protein F4823DRAFT_640643 [Ustulina deusta]